MEKKLCEHREHQAQAGQSGTWFFLTLVFGSVGLLAMLVIMLMAGVPEGIADSALLIVGVIVSCLALLLFSSTSVSHEAAVFALYDGCSCGKPLSQGEWDKHREVILFREEEKRIHAEANQPYRPS